MDSLQQFKTPPVHSALGADFLDAAGTPTFKAFGQSGAWGQTGRTLASRVPEHHGCSGRQYHDSWHDHLGISAGAGVALGWGALRVSQGELALSTLLVVLMLGVEVFRPLRELSRLYHRGMIAMSAAKGIFALMDTPPAVQEPSESRVSPGGTIVDPGHRVRDSELRISQHGPS